LSEAGWLHITPHRLTALEKPPWSETERIESKTGDCLYAVPALAGLTFSPFAYPDHKVECVECARLKEQKQVMEARLARRLALLTAGGAVGDFLGGRNAAREAHNDLERAIVELRRHQDQHRIRT
jgi:hypothetical protein